MEIQRQSDYYGLDRPEPRQAHLTADQIAALISGPQITPGLLNTRTAAPMTSPGEGGASEMDMALAVGPDNAPKSVGVVAPGFGAGVDMLIDYVNDDADSQYGIESDFRPEPEGM